MWNILLTLCLILPGLTWAGVVKRQESVGPAGQEVFTGKATWNEWHGAQTACGGYGDDAQAITALKTAQFGTLNNDAPVCGKTITVSFEGKEAQATIVEQGGEGYGGLDLSTKVFEQLLPLAEGTAIVTWWFNDYDPEPEPAPPQSSGTQATVQPAATPAASTPSEQGANPAGPNAASSDGGSCDKGAKRCLGNTYQMCDIRDNATKLGEWVFIAECRNSCQVQQQAVSCI